LLAAEGIAPANSAAATSIDRFSIPHYGGLRIPTLERVEVTPDRLDEILATSKRALPAM